MTAARTQSTCGTGTPFPTGEQRCYVWSLKPKKREPFGTNETSQDIKPKTVCRIIRVNQAGQACLYEVFGHCKLWSFGRIMIFDGFNWYNDGFWSEPNRTNERMMFLIVLRPSPAYEAVVECRMSLKSLIECPLICQERLKEVSGDLAESVRSVCFAEQCLLDCSRCIRRRATSLHTSCYICL